MATKLLASAAAVAALGLIASPAVAQESAYGPAEGDWEFTIAGGGNNDKDFENGAFSTVFDIGYYLNDDWSVGARQGFGFAGDNDDLNFDASTSVYTNYHFNLDRWRPFIGASLGYIYGEDVEETFVAGPEVGVKYYIKEDAFIYGRMTYEFLFDSADDADDRFDDGRFVYGLGIGLNF